MLINFLNKGSETIKTLEYPGQQGVTCLSVLCSLVSKTFEMAKEMDCEIYAITAVTLANAILENVKDVGSIVIPCFLDMYISQLQEIETPEFKNVLMQGFMMCFWYDFNTTQAYLESRGATAHILQLTLTQVVTLKELDEIKRYSLGLTNMLTAPVCQTLSENYTNVIKALTFLSSSSVQIRDKNKEKKNRGDQAEVEEEHGVMCEDEDDCGIDLDSDDEDDEAYDINNEEQEC